MANALGFPSFTLTNPNGAVLTVNGDDIADPAGGFWTLDGELGGWDSADGRVTMLTKIGDTPAADGEIPADLHYRGRSLAFTLSAEYETEAAREAGWRFLGEVLDLVNIGAPGVLLVAEQVPLQLSVVRTGNNNQGRATVENQGFLPKSAQSRLEDGTSLGGIPLGTPAFLLKATIELYAQDPRKYPPNATTVSGTGSVTTAGGSTTSQNGILTLSTTGGGSGPITVTVGGRTLSLRVPTPPGGPTLSPIPAELVIDLYNETIEDNLGNNYYYLRDMQTPWPILPLGAFTLTVSPSQPVQLVHFPAYL